MASASPSADIDLTPLMEGSGIALFDRLHEQNPVHWNDEPGDGAAAFRGMVELIGSDVVPRLG